MNAIILDTETTGLQDPHATEIAWIEIDPAFTATGKEFCERFNPQKPIEAGASKVTGIYDKDVAHLPPHSTFTLPDTTYLIGHNVQYDLKVLRNAGVNLSKIKPICTCVLARQFFSELPKFSLGALLAHFYPNDKATYQNHAHGAYHDVLFTHKVLMALNERIGVNDFETLFLKSLPTIMPFGKHKGKKISQVPIDYRLWLAKQDIDEPLRVALRKLDFKS